MILQNEVIIISTKRILHGLPDGVGRENLCYYLSDDYAVYCKIKQKYADNLNVQLLGQEFHKLIQSIFNEFLSLSHRINQQNQYYAFWGTHLASRNSGTIPLLKYLVYFQFTKKIFDQADSKVVLISDSLALAKLIQAEAGIRGMRCQLHLLIEDKIGPVGFFFKSLAKLAYFLFFMVTLWIYSRLLKNNRIRKHPDRGIYIIRSWVNASSIGRNGNYQDRNFGELPKFLSEQGKDVWTIPLYFNLDRSIFSQIKLMSETGYQFIFPEQYLSLLDIIRTIRDGLKSLFPDLKNCEFSGHEVKSLIKEIHWSVCCQPLLLSFNSINYLIKRFAEHKISIERFLYPLENNPPEKPFIQAVRQYYPLSKIIGFQHTVWFKEQLGGFLLPEERSYHPLPDKIICSGRRYLEILKKTGFPSSLLTLGPNLRYTSVHNNQEANYLSDRAEGNKQILIILNYETNHSMELLQKIGASLGKFENINIDIKAHPATPIQQIKNFLRHIRFPFYRWVNGSVQEWVLKSDVVIMAGSSVSNLEVMATGVPLIRVSLENNFDFDCLWNEYPFAPFVDSVNEICRYLGKAFQMNEEDREKLIEFGKMIIRDYFEPVTPKKLNTFL